jgi:hypothetical protein
MFMSTGLLKSIIKIIIIFKYTFKLFDKDKKYYQKLITNVCDHYAYCIHC